MRTLKLQGYNLEIVDLDPKKCHRVECPHTMNSPGQNRFCTILCAWFSKKEGNNARCYCGDILIGKLNDE